MSDLFGEETFDYKKEWQDMPEFIQENLRTIHQVTISFLTTEDMNEFSELIGRRISFTTKSVLFPVKEKSEKRVYVDEA
jgi:hypothetical protein